MRVRCISNSASLLPNPYLDERYGLGSESVFPLTAGRLYVVYAIFIRFDSFWFQIQDDDEWPYPIAYPAPLFEVVSGRISALWRFALTPSHADHVALFAPEAWVADPFFYDRLTDGHPTEVAVFQSDKQTIDREEE
jgi:hypothetical protein